MEHQRLLGNCHTAEKEDLLFGFFKHVRHFLCCFPLKFAVCLFTFFFIFCGALCLIIQLKDAFVLFDNGEQWYGLATFTFVIGVFHLFLGYCGCRFRHDQRFAKFWVGFFKFRFFFHLFCFLSFVLFLVFLSDVVNIIFQWLVGRQQQMSSDVSLSGSGSLDSFDITSVPSILGIITMVVVILFIVWVHFEFYYVEVWGGPQQAGYVQITPQHIQLAVQNHGEEYAVGQPVNHCQQA